MSTQREQFINKCISAGAREASDEHLGNANIHRPDMEALLKELSAMFEQEYCRGFNDGWEKGAKKPVRREYNPLICHTSEFHCTFPECACGK